MKRGCGLPLVYIELRHLTFSCSSGAAQCSTTKHCSCTEQLPGVSMCNCMNAKQLSAGKKKKKDDACLAEKAWLRLKKQTAGTAVVVFVCVLLTQTVGQEVGGEALGAVAHGCVVVCVSAKHQHRPAHYHRCVEVTEEAAVSQNGPAHAHSDGCYTVRRCTAVTIRQAVCAQKWVSSVVTIPTCCCCNGFVTKESVKHRCSYLQLYNKSNK